ncbi:MULTISPECIES: ribonuclease M5 [unclassified Oceanispirochaeta]|uniref:ribonuclease M5 n=1 Tax=unclassified Oceanispirochaeta TaxID=2635722 RepID=UPI000E08D651|nr:MULTISPECIES: ribonuclease M5 [unclassified Oceanispirochaeta]MBF9015760.1 ribonuclease M5 [Oceanispirochaeta sp. M2]NPD72223.1 ribonuclease M5 [Oceanispirochaeta sp. M1]RDG32321.1 ribonuclease M5 [Oceanispirochaeta sp. M1]
MLKIQELIVVEGVDDVDAVKKAVQAEVLPVHGFAVKSKKTLDKIRFASERVGVIILTDPDHAGETIRDTIEKAVPKVKHAYISRKEGTKKDNIGVENATPEAIRAALEKARFKMVEELETFNLEDMDYYGLSGTAGSKEKRQDLGQILHIGYGNTKQFLARLNHFGISRKELEEAIDSLN